MKWNETKGTSKGSTSRDIERFTLGFNDNKIRLVGPLFPRYVYWVTTKDGKKVPQQCLAFDSKTESMNPNAKDPFKEIPEGVYEGKPEFAYVCNVIDRADGKLKLFDLKMTIYKGIVQYATDPEYGDPSDPKTGYDITISKEKTGSAPQNVKYTVKPGRSSKALTTEELALELYDLEAIMKKPTYEEQKKWLIENTNYFVGANTGDFSVETPEDLG